MNYEDVSDFEISKAVSSLVDFGDLIVTANDSNETVYLCDKDGFFDMVPISHFDPCNNPSDAWPIIVENKIGIMHNWNKEGYWSAISPKSGCDYDCNGRNPLRAAMICFLKMKDAENDN